MYLPRFVLDSVLIFSCPESVFPADLDPTILNPGDVVKAPSSFDGVSLASTGSAQDIPIHLIVDMDNSFELNAQTGPLQGPPPEDPSPFIELKPKNKRKNSPISQITSSPGGVLTKKRKTIDCGSDSRGVGRPSNAVSRERQSQVDIVDGA